jgi:hypothetical protein
MNKKQSWNIPIEEKLQIYSDIIYPMCDCIEKRKYQKEVEKLKNEQSLLRKQK